MTRLLDLFCGAGGAGMGYSRAGFEVVGVDIEPQPRYPFEFVQADALEYVAAHGDEFDAVHASPPCQAYSRLRYLPWLRDRDYWDSIPPTLEALRRLRVPWILENVPGAPVDGITLCGTMFGLAYPDGKPLYRHRLFESPVFMLAPGHAPHRETLAERIVGPTGTTHLNSGRVIGGHNVSLAVGQATLGVPWMTRAELTQAIPPAYTEWLGAELLRYLEGAAGAA